MTEDLFQSIVRELLRRKADPPAGKAVSGETQAWCPFHADGEGKAPHSPSLRLNREKRVWFCDPCDDGGKLTELAERLGLETRGYREDGIVATYDYRDADGQLLFQVVRWTGKRFAVRRPDDRGNWIWNLVGVQRVLYHLDELQSAVADRSTTRATPSLRLTASRPLIHRRAASFLFSASFLSSPFRSSSSFASGFSR